MCQGRENVSDGPTRPSHDPPPPEDPPPPWPAVDSELQKAINTRKASRSKIGATDAIMQGALEGDSIEIGESTMEAQGVTVGHETDPPIDAPNFVAAFRNLVLCGIKTNIALSFTPVRCVSQFCNRRPCCAPFLPLVRLGARLLALSTPSALVRSPLLPAHSPISGRKRGSSRQSG